MSNDFAALKISDSPSAGNGKKHWAGAQRPKAETAEKTFPRQALGAAAKPAAIPPSQSNPADDVYTSARGVNIELKLRQQAAKLGLIPGSPRWRAYVLGTLSANRRRKGKKPIIDAKGQTGVVTPGK